MLIPQLDAYDDHVRVELLRTSHDAGATAGRSVCAFLSASDSL